MMPYIDRSWTLFLDRDGVINRRPVNDYVKNNAEFDFLPGVVEALRLLAGMFGRIVLVTNQQGVGLGLMTNEQLDAVHKFMLEQVNEGGGRIDLLLCCTDVKTQPDNCRKPSAKMAYDAVEALPDIVLNKSVMVGDTESDLLFGKNAGMYTVQIGDESTSVSPDQRCRSLYQFAKMCHH